MRRKLFNDLYQHLPKKEFTILTGARQTGKSTLLRDLENECKKDKLPTVFINLENKELLSLLDANPLNVLSFISFQEAYPAIEFNFGYLYPWSEDFFRGNLF